MAQVEIKKTEEEQRLDIESFKRAFTLKKELGNNGTSSSKRVRKYAFTLNNPEEGCKDYILRTFEQKRGKYIQWQLEKGKNGTFHFQGCMEFHSCISMKTINYYIFQNKAWLGPARNWDKLKEYCCKEDTRVGELVKKEFSKHELLDYIISSYKGKISKLGVAKHLANLVRSGVIDKPYDVRRSREMCEVVLLHLENNIERFFISYEEEKVEKFCGVE